MYSSYQIFLWRSHEKTPKNWQSKQWLPHGYSQIFTLYLLGLKDYGSATPHCKIRSLPFLELRPTPSNLAQSKERKGSNFAIWQHWPARRRRRISRIRNENPIWARMKKGREGTDRKKIWACHDRKAPLLSRHCEMEMLFHYEFVTVWKYELMNGEAKLGLIETYPPLSALSAGFYHGRVTVFCASSRHFLTSSWHLSLLPFSTRQQQLYS